jgi:hypothetical protein
MHPATTPRTSEPTVVPARRSGGPIGTVAARRCSKPVAVYVAAHAALVAVTWLFLAHAHLGLIKALEAGDGGWYVAVASLGYEHHLVYVAPGVPGQMRIAFFPLLPLLIRAVADVTFLGGFTAGLLITAVASLFAAAGIYALVGRFAGHATALATVALWAVMPTAIFQSMIYSEALYAALAAWALYALLESRWLTAAGLTLVAGLSRPSAIALVLVVCAACAVAIARNRGRWRAAAGLLLAPCGVAGYLLWIGIRLHNLDAWFISQRAQGWQSSFDFGRQTLQTISGVASLNTTWPATPYDFVAAFLLVGLGLALALALDRRTPLVLSAWTWLGVLITLGTAGPWVSKARFFLPYFPLLVPVAAVLGRARLRNQIITVVVVVLLSGWWSAYFLSLTKVIAL